jgi:hypothetical protein
VMRVRVRVMVGVDAVRGTPVVGHSGGPGVLTIRQEKTRQGWC